MRTLNYKLKFNKCKEKLKLVGHCDSDWANSRNRLSGEE